tara:strand:+ start:690 stop:890 length:201 start_codon:yes stop_codon:yes gene_type:complete
MEKLEYMEGLVLVNEKNQLEESLERIIVDFRNEGFMDDDIYDYIRDITLTQLHKKFDDIKKLLRNG